MSNERLQDCINFFESLSTEQKTALHKLHLYDGFCERTYEIRPMDNKLVELCYEFAKKTEKKASTEKA